MSLPYPKKEREERSILDNYFLICMSVLFRENEYIEIPNYANDNTLYTRGMGVGLWIVCGPFGRFLNVLKHKDPFLFNCSFQTREYLFSQKYYFRFFVTIRFDFLMTKYVMHRFPDKKFLPSITCTSPNFVLKVPIGISIKISSQ